MTGLGAKAPSAGASLQLEAPAGDVLADLLVAALLDVSTLPRGYITSAQRPAPSGEVIDN